MPGIYIFYLFFFIVWLEIVQLIITEHVKMSANYNMNAS